MIRSESANNVMEAIFNVQHSVQPIDKTAVGSTGQRDYGYTPLDGVWVAIEQAMKTEKLAVVASPTTGNNYVGRLFQTTIFHIESGEWIQDTMDMTVVKDAPQDIGSAITYYRRYMLISMLGLQVKGSDSDASEHKLATAQQKAKLIGAVKQVFPEVEDKVQIIETIKNIVGKHPSYIREDEADDALTLIKAFKNEQVSS